MKKAVAGFLVVFSLLGCGATSGLMQKNDQESLTKSSDLYYKLVMWKYYEKAAQFVDPAKQKEYEAFVTANDKDLNITGYEIKEIVYLTEGESETEPAHKETDECVIRVLYTYYKYPSVSEKSVMAEDKWIKKGKLWYNSSDFGPGTFN